MTPCYFPTSLDFLPKAFQRTVPQNTVCFFYSFFFFCASPELFSGTVLEGNSHLVHFPSKNGSREQFRRTCLGTNPTDNAVRNQLRSLLILFLMYAQQPVRVTGPPRTVMFYQKLNAPDEESSSVLVGVGTDGCLEDTMVTKNNSSGTTLTAQPHCSHAMIDDVILHCACSCIVREIRTSSSRWLLLFR